MPRGLRRQQVASAASHILMLHRRLGKERAWLGKERA